MSATNYLGLNIPDKNSKGRVVTDVFEPNFTKLDQNAEVVDIDKNAIWGGEYGGYIQDTSVTKVVGKRYIDQIDKKAYICRVAGSHVNTTANYEECNVVKNLKEVNLLKNEETYYKQISQSVAGVLHATFDIKAIKKGNVVAMTLNVNPVGVGTGAATTQVLDGVLLPPDFRPVGIAYGLARTDTFSKTCAFSVRHDGTILVEFNGSLNVGAGLGDSIAYVV